MTAKIVDEAGHEVADGEIGTLLVKGDSIAASYYLQHEKTKNSMLGEWFTTGDNYYRDKEGYYYYYGRGNDMMKVGGIWVSPIEIESTIIAHPAVREVAVVPKTDEHSLIKPKAFVVLREGFVPSKELEKEIQAYVKANLARYKYPRWIEFIKELPKTATGKIQRYKLRE
jgi:benzoate-CoA ligase